MNTTEMQSRLAIAQGAVLRGDRRVAAHRHGVVRGGHGAEMDKWLVRTVGLLVAAIGGALTAAGARRSVTPEIVGLAIGASAGLGLIDVVYSTKGRISKIYLADAAAEAALIVAWGATR